MAVNDSRSMNADLIEGITDGMVKKANPDRGGFPNDVYDAGAVRSSLSQPLYDPVAADNPMKGYAGARLVAPPAGS